MQYDTLTMDAELRSYLGAPESRPEVELDHDSNAATQWFAIQIARRKTEYVLFSEERIWDYDFYVLETAALVEQYSDQLKIPIKMSFGKKRRAPRVPNAWDALFLHIISRLYVSCFWSTRVDKYVLLQTPKVTTAACAQCAGASFCADRDNELFVVCVRCGTRRELACAKMNHGDSKRINISQKNLYDKRNHFLDCINQFQGTQKYTLSEELIQQIEGRLEKYNLVDYGQSTRAQKFARVGKQHVQLILKELGISKEHYENMNLIYHTLTGKALHDISALKENLLMDFDLFNEHYNRKFPDIEKKTFNYQHLLYQFLCRHKYKCKPSDFNFLKTTERKSYHDDTYRVIFQEIGWNYIPLF